MGMNIKVEGLKNAERFLKNASKETYDKVNQGVKDAGFFIQAEVQQSIAGNRDLAETVDTGRFLNSVKSEQKKPLTATISTNVSYAKHLEYGTSRMKSRPHFRNTATKNQTKVQKFIEKKVKEAIR